MRLEAFVVQCAVYSPSRLRVRQTGGYFGLHGKTILPQLALILKARKPTIDC
jgi:hypothetical protein